MGLHRPYDDGLCTPLVCLVTGGEGTSALGRDEPSSFSASDDGKTSATEPPSFSNVACRLYKETNVHPLWASPILKRTISFVACSMKMAIPSHSLTTAPINESCGRSSSLGGGSAGACTKGGGLALDRSEGRRDGEKIGRWRVFGNSSREINRSGFPSRGGFAEF